LIACVGYLPQDADARNQRIRELEALALKTGQTQLFIETPYRNAVLQQALLQTLQHHTRLCIARGLTLAGASVRSDTVKGWRASNTAADARLPAVFALGR
ncbi:MAG: ribosomal RNA small subunit methyltransferase I, partial [Comamonadaceae bacterium]